MRSVVQRQRCNTIPPQRVPVKYTLILFIVILLAQRISVTAAWQPLSSSASSSLPRPHRCSVGARVPVGVSRGRARGVLQTDASTNNSRNRRIVGTGIDTDAGICLAAVSAASSANEESSDAVPSDTSTSSSSTDDTTASDVSVPKKKINYEWTKQNLSIALPALIGMLADPLLSLMDTAYVGRLGSTELAALGACTSIFHLAFNAFRATTAATTSLVATSLQDDPEEARQVTLVSLQLGLGIGVAVTAILLMTGRYALAGMGVDTASPLYKPAADYLFTRCWAAPVVLLIGVAEGAFRGYGDTIVPAMASLTAAVMNLVLDPLMIFSPLHWGVKGAAAATAMSQVGAAFMYAWKIVQRKMLPQRKSTKTATATATTAMAATAISTLGSPAPLETALDLPAVITETDTSDSTSTSTSTPSEANDAVSDNTTPTPNDMTPVVKRKKKSRWVIIRTILVANLAMLTKQGSLLLAWAVATGRATRLGAEHVAAHQVALSVWLVFALILDGTAVSAQVLSSRAYASKDQKQVNSLTKYMVQFAIFQGLVSMLVVDALAMWVPTIFTPDPLIQGHLHKIMPCVAYQQVLVSLTLVVESLAVGANQFQALAFGTALATVVSIWQLFGQTSVEGIWNSGIVTLFAGRLATAVFACARAQYKLRRECDAIAAKGAAENRGGMAVANATS